MLLFFGSGWNRRSNHLPSPRHCPSVGTPLVGTLSQHSFLAGSTADQPASRPAGRPAMCRPHFAPALQMCWPAYALDPHMCRPRTFAGATYVPAPDFCRPHKCADPTFAWVPQMGAARDGPRRGPAACGVGRRPLFSFPAFQLLDPPTHHPERAFQIFLKNSFKSSGLARL